MRSKTIPSLLLFIIAISLFAFVQAQPQTQQKGASLFRGKPPKPPKPGPAKKGIATGVVSNPPQASDRWAVIIGISDYKGDAYDLGYCDDDAWDFYNALVNEYGWSSNHITMLIDSQATKANILGAIDWMRANEGSGDEVVFFYSGHGSTSTCNADNDPERKDECIIPWEIEQYYYIGMAPFKKNFLASNPHGFSSTSTVVTQVA